MRTNVILSLVLVCLLVCLSSSANSYLTTLPSAAPVCSNNAGVIEYAAVDVKEANAGTVTAYEKVSYYFDSGIKDNVEMRALYDPTDNSKIQLISMGRDLVFGTTKSFTRVNGETIHALLGRLLITRFVNAAANNQVGFRAYHYGQTGAALTAKQILLTSVGATPFANAQLTLVRIDEKTNPLICEIYLYLSATTAGFYALPITITTMIQTSAIRKTNTENEITTFPTGANAIWGDDLLMINAADGLCYRNAGGQMQRLAVCNIAGGATATYTMNAYPLIWNTMVIVSSKASTAGAVAYGIGGGSATIIGLSSVSTAYRSFTDDIRNVFVIGGVTGSTVAWISVKGDETIIAASIPTTTESLFFGATAVSLANHRAFILNPTEIAVVEATSGSTDIQLIRKIINIPTAATTLTATQDFKLTTKCNILTYLPKRFSCFASTFNCVLTSKAVAGDSVLQIETVGTL